MDDVWLPIMHSAMDTRSNVTNDALKDPELTESEVCELWTLLLVVVYSDGHLNHYGNMTSTCPVSKCSSRYRTNSHLFSHIFLLPVAAFEVCILESVIIGGQEKSNTKRLKDCHWIGSISK